MSTKVNINDGNVYEDILVLFKLLKPNLLKTEL